MKANKIILGAAILVMVGAIAMAIVLADSRDSLLDRIDELEKLNRKYLADNSCLQAENNDLGKSVSALNAMVLDIQGQNTTLTEKIFEIHPWIGTVLDLTANGVWCSRVPGHLERTRELIAEWYQWVQENMETEIEAKKKK